MTDLEILIEVAKLDNWYIIHDESSPNTYGLRHETDHNYRSSWFDSVQECWQQCPDYLTSRDAIVPVIEKQLSNVVESLLMNLRDFRFSDYQQRRFYLLCSPRQLCIALLKATGKYKE